MIPLLLLTNIVLLRTFYTYYHKSGQNELRLSPHMNNTTYISNLRLHLYLIRTEIVLLQKHTRLKRTSAATVLRETQTNSTYYKVYTTPSDPLEYSPWSLELYYSSKRIRFQRRIYSLYLNEPTPTILLYKQRYQENIYEYNFHPDHYPFLESHSRVPPDLHDLL